MNAQYVPVEGLYAFWRYDLYPYLLGAPVTHINGEGRIKAKGYEGFSFNPVKLVSLDAGHAIYQQLKAIDHDAARQRKAFEQKLQDELDAFFTQHHIPISR